MDGGDRRSVRQPLEGERIEQDPGDIDWPERSAPTVSR